MRKTYTFKDTNMCIVNITVYMTILGENRLLTFLTYVTLMLYFTVIPLKYYNRSQVKVYDYVDTGELAKFISNDEM